MSLTDRKIIVHAGPHDRDDCPVTFALPEPLPDGSWELVSEAGDVRPLRVRRHPATACFVEAGLSLGESRVYRLRQLPDSEQNQPIVIVEPDDESDENSTQLQISVRGYLFTRYVYRGVKARPYFYPLMSPQGVGVTRSFPMKTDVPDEKHDHPHHRSMWIAHGDVNGTDNWSEEAGHGFTKHISVDDFEDGDVVGGFTTTSCWTDAHNLGLLNQHLYVNVWGTSDAVRIMDVRIYLGTQQRREVHFGDTKEGGILSVRVASEMDVPRTGRIENVYGGVNEGETWGKAAHWCDYSGKVEGKRVGIAVLDHPLSFRYPTHWHVRDYGLMTANPFGYAAFTNDQKFGGGYTLRPGETMVFHYRVIIHEGNASEGRVNNHYLNFVAPPRVTVE